MGLYERLTRIDLDLTTSSKIQVHQFCASLGELERGKMTKAQIVTAFNLTAGEQTELDTLIPKIQPFPESYSLGGFTTLTDITTAFDGIPAAKGLGFIGLDVTGISQLTARIRYNKVTAPGTLSWQLWNETDAQQLGLLDDANAAGDKQADLVVTPGAPLSGGAKVLRLRVKHTIATGDALYYGSTLFVRRVSALTAEHLHHIIMIAERQIPPLDTIAAVKARLGV